jgi:hypothetical protein
MLQAELEADFQDSFASCVKQLHQLRRDRNRVLHSAFIELKPGGEVHGILRSGSKLQVDEETGETLFDHEVLTAESFTSEMKSMVEIAVFLNRAYVQLVHRYPNGGA